MAFWGARVDADVDDELTFHVDMLVRRYLAQGFSEHDARRAANARVGDLRRARTTCLTIGHRRQRRMARAQMLDALAQDVRYGLRTLGRARGWTAVALVTLALGIGASTAMFTVLNSLILNPLSYPGADRVATVWRADLKSGVMMTPRNAMVDAWERSARSFDAFEPYSKRPVVMAGAGDATTVSAAIVRGDFPAFAGQPLIIGRTFAPEEMLPNGPRVAILGEGLWRERFASSSGVIGKILLVDDKPFAIVGVASARMRLPEIDDVRPRLWLPLIADTSAMARGLAVRVKPGVTMEAAASELDGILARSGILDRSSSQKLAVRLARPTEFVSFKSSLYLLSGAVALLLVVACANVAHLLLARGAMRARELAIRSALGAGRRRLLRQLITESLILATFGGVLGVGVAVGAVKLLLAARPARLDALAATNVDASALWVSLALALLTGLVFGFTAAIDAVRRTASEALRHGAISDSANRQSHRVRSVLVVTEMALSAMLLVGATLLVRTVMRLHAIDPGFDTAGLYSVNFDLPYARYPNSASRRAFVDALVARTKLIAGVKSVAKANSIPPDAGFMMSDLEIDGVPDLPAAHGPLAVNMVAPDFFETVGIPVLEGATFATNARTRNEVIINRGFAKTAWPSASAIGKRIRFSKGGSIQPEWMTVVGVVNDVTRFSLRDNPQLPLVYQALDENAIWPEVTLAIRMRGNTNPASSIRDVLKLLDPLLPAPAVKTAQQALDETMATEAFTMVLLAVFAGLAVVLSAIGLYGVISFVVAQRTREIGIRVALGATRRDVAGPVAARGLALAAIGLGVGLSLSAWGTRLIAHSLYGVSGADLGAYVATAAVLLTVSIAACLLPTARALSVDPAIAMRGD